MGRFQGSGGYLEGGSGTEGSEGSGQPEEVLWESRSLGEILNGFGLRESRKCQGPEDRVEPEGVSGAGAPDERVGGSWEPRSVGVLEVAADPESVTGPWVLKGANPEGL